MRRKLMFWSLMLAAAMVLLSATLLKPLLAPKLRPG